MWLSEMVWFFSTWARPLLLKLSQLESGLNRQNSNPIWEHGSKPSFPGLQYFLKNQCKWHLITALQACSVPLLVQIRLTAGHTTREEYAAISQPEQLKLQKFFISPQQERHSGHSRLSKPSASLFSGAVHYSSLTMQIYSDSSNICSCLK